MKNPAFITPADHFERLVGEIPEEDRDLFLSMDATHVDTGYAGRTFIVYDVDRHGEVLVLDRLTILDLYVNDTHGATTEVRSERKGETVIVGYTPERMFDLEVFMWLPLHMRVNWDAVPDEDTGYISRCSAGFNLCIKTASRRYPTETGTTHCETGFFFKRNFPDVSDEV